MKSLMIFILFFANVTLSIAENSAITENDKKVILNNDGTWKYEEEGTKKLDSVDCSEWVEPFVDKVSGESYKAGSNHLIVSDDGKNSLSFVFARSADDIVMVLITAIGAGSCIDKGDLINVVFTDGTRTELFSNAGFNCNKKARVFFKEGDGKNEKLNMLTMKKIKTMRVWTNDSYVENNFTEDQSSVFKNTMQCLYHN